MASPIIIQDFTEKELYPIFKPFVDLLVHSEIGTDFELIYGPIVANGVEIELEVKYSVTTGIMHIYARASNVNGAPVIHMMGFAARFAKFVNDEEELRKAIFNRFSSVIIQYVKPYLLKEG